MYFYICFCNEVIANLSAHRCSFDNVFLALHFQKGLQRWLAKPEQKYPELPCFFLERTASLVTSGGFCFPSVHMARRQPFPLLIYYKSLLSIFNLYFTFTVAKATPVLGRQSSMNSTVLSLYCWFDGSASLKLPDKTEDPMPACESRQLCKLVMTEVLTRAAAAGTAFQKVWAGLLKELARRNSGSSHGGPGWASVRKLHATSKIHCACLWWMLIKSSYL